MRRFECIALCLILLVVFLGCGGGGYKDQALLKQASRSLQRVTAALEQYRIEYKTYPPGGCDLGEKLAGYFVAVDTAGNETNEWPEMVNLSFYGQIEYETPDSLYSYFVKVRALDTKHTPLTIRSNRKPEEKKPQKRRR